MAEFKVKSSTVDKVIANSFVIEVVQRRYGIKTDADMSLVEFRDGDVEEGSMKIAKANKRLYSLRKKLFLSPEWDAIKNFDQQTYRFIQGRALKSNLRKGCYRLPSTLFDELWDWIEGRKQERQPLIEAFVGAYENLKEAARDDLGPGFKESDYDDSETVLSKFFFDCNILEEDVPHSLKTLSQKVYNKEVEKQRSRVAKEVEAMVLEMRVGFAEIIKNAMTLTEPTKKGNVKQFSGTSIKKFEAFLDLFEKRNIAGDTELSGLAKKLRETLKGVVDRGKDYVKDEAAVNATRAAFAQINIEMEDMLVESAGRKQRVLKE